MDNKATSVRSGYTLPVFACAAAIAAYRKLQSDQSPAAVTVELINPDQSVSIPIEQVARLDEHTALAITRSDPGENLDLTRNTPIWAKVEYGNHSDEPIRIIGGEGIGRQLDQTAAIYSYAHKVIQHNLAAAIAQSQAKEERQIQVTIILPEGKSLAKRTSNEAFGVVEGLSLLGTSGVAQALSAPKQLQAFQQELRQKANCHSSVVFCLGENGLDIARRMGIPETQLIKTANWLGPMLVLAGKESVSEVLLLGYHGKLIKLAGGIFHTHHHLADGRQEIFTAIAAGQGAPPEMCQLLLSSPTVEASLQALLQWQEKTDQDWVGRIYQEMTTRIETKAANYIYVHSQKTTKIGCLLFNRDRKIFAEGSKGKEILAQILASQS